MSEMCNHEAKTIMTSWRKPDIENDDDYYVMFKRMKRTSECDVLIVDESSMIHNFMYHLLKAVNDGRLGCFCRR